MLAQAYETAFWRNCIYETQPHDTEIRSAKRKSRKGSKLLN